MEQDRIMELMRLIAMVFCFTILSIIAGCNTQAWIKNQALNQIIGKLNDVTAQRLWASTKGLELINYGDYKLSAEARKEVLELILKGGEVPAAVARAVQTGERISSPEKLAMSAGQIETNAAIEAMKAVKAIEVPE